MKYLKRPSEIKIYLKFKISCIKRFYFLSFSKKKSNYNKFSFRKSGKNFLLQKSLILISTEN